MEYTERTDSISKRTLYLSAVLWAVCPPSLIVFIIIWVIKPAIKGRIPGGISYVLWILGLMAWGEFLKLPFGSVETISQALKDPTLSRLTLYAETIGSIASILLVIFTFRKIRIPNPYLPLNSFRVDKTIILLWLLSFLPLLRIVLPKSISTDSGDAFHPLIIAFVSCIRNGVTFPIVIGFLSIGLLGPIFEEIIFRGLLLEESREKERKKWVRVSLDLMVSLFFAVLHLPVSFVIPFILALATIYVRRRSKSLLPPMVMHISWNSSILFTILLLGS